MLHGSYINIDYIGIMLLPRSVLIILFTLSIVCSGHSQDYTVRDRDYLYYGYDNNPYQLDYREIEGSPFRVDSLVEGYIFLKDSGIVRIPLRYNIYEDEIEYLDDQNLMILENVNQIDYITIGEDTIVYKRYNNGNDQGYLVQKVRGDCSLYAKYVIEYHEMEAPITSYHSPKPPSFVHRAPQWYVSMDDGPMEHVDLNSSEFNDLFGVHARTMKAYKKSQKLKFGREEDVIRLFEHFNVLLGSEQGIDG